MIDDNAPWIVGPAERDPLRGRCGTSVLPQQVSVRLKEIDACRAPFQRVAIAHELDPAGPVNPFLSSIRYGPHTCRDDLARRLVGKPPVYRGASEALAMLDWVCSGGRSAAPPFESVGSGRRLVVFGVTAPTLRRDRQPCLWYPLTVWRW